MTTQGGSNLNVCAVEGNFDDIQTGVKKIFNNEKMACELDRYGYFLSSANSINFGRLAPQIVYYFKAYCDMLRDNDTKLGEQINLCVPTGNFGNILAAYIAKLMGLPISKLICASNSNNILTDFLRTGRYDKNRGFNLTISPSMDILISSNLERLLYLVAGTERTVQCMKDLSQNGFYEIDSDTMSNISNDFVGYFASEEQTLNTIKQNYSEYGYLMDTHTAVAFSALEQYRKEHGDNTKTVIASTASPYKFAQAVYGAIYGDNSYGDLEILEQLSENTNTKIPTPLFELDKKQVNFDSVTKPNDMYNEVLNFINK